MERWEMEPRSSLPSLLSAVPILLTSSPHVRQSDGVVPCWARKARENAAGLEYPTWSAPVLSRGVLYLRGKDRLAAFEMIPPAAP